ncbi:MAG: acyltransferase [Saprospirales bacterium]|nr:acyltransferase [Saprospirales bacterium]
MVILIFHFGKSIIIFSYFFKNIISCGNSAVSFFFILSGFIMVIANTDNRNETKKIVAKDYYKKRFERIYPLYFLSLILYLVFCNDYINNSSKLYSFLSSLFLIQAWIPKFASDFNFPGWSLSVEVFFYLISCFYNKIRSYATFKIAVFVTLFWL